MKKIMMVFVCLMTMVMSVNAQKFNYFEVEKTMYDGVYDVSTKEITAPNNTALAGKYLKISANCEWISLGLAAASGGLAALAADKSHDKSSRDFYTGGAIVLGVGSLVAYVFKIHYKHKSGKTLELVGNGVRLNF